MSAYMRYDQFLPQLSQDTEGGNVWYEMLENLVRTLSRQKKMALPSLNGLEMVDIFKIVRLEAEGSYTRLYFLDGVDMLITRKLGEFEEILPDPPFYRIHRSHIINLQHLVRYQRLDGGFVEMADGSQIGVSKRKKEAFLKKLSQL